MPRHFYQRIVSALISLTFIFSQLPAVPSYAAVPLNPKSLPDNLSGVRVPEEWGKIVEVWTRDQGQVTRDQIQKSLVPGHESFVVLIQDAHAIPDAQRNIQNLIGHFQKSMA